MLKKSKNFTHKHNHNNSLTISLKEKFYAHLNIMQIIQSFLMLLLHSDAKSKGFECKEIFSHAKFPYEIYFAACRSAGRCSGCGASDYVNEQPKKYYWWVNDRPKNPFKYIFIIFEFWPWKPKLKVKKNLEVKPDVRPDLIWIQVTS